MSGLPSIPFGRTGLVVSRLAFGGASLAGATDADADRLVATALEEGVTLFDAAQCYGRAEEHLGRALAGCRSEVTLVTKCGHHEVLADGSWRSLDIGAADIDAALRRLRTDHIDAMLLHSYDPDPSRLERAFDVLRAARTAGKVCSIGYSGDNEGAKLAISTPDIDVLELSLSVADQANVLALLPIAEARGIAVMTKRSLANAAWRHLGRPEDTWRDAHDAPYVRRLRAMGCSAASAPDGLGWDESALRFVFQSAGVHAAIIGASDPDKLRRNAENARRLAGLPVDADAYAAWRRRFSEAEARVGETWRALN